MRFQTNIDYSVDSERRRLAKQLSLMVSGLDNSEVPYMSNENQTDFWTLDIGNNWKLQFFDNEPFIFEVRYRYNHDSHPIEQKFGEWISIKMNLTII